MNMPFTGLFSSTVCMVLIQHPGKEKCYLKCYQTLYITGYSLDNWICQHIRLFSFYIR